MPSSRKSPRPPRPRVRTRCSSTIATISRPPRARSSGAGRVEHRGRAGGRTAERGQGDSNSHPSGRQPDALTDRAMAPWVVHRRLGDDDGCCEQWESRFLLPERAPRRPTGTTYICTACCFPRTITCQSASCGTSPPGGTMQNAPPALGAGGAYRTLLVSSDGGALRRPPSMLEPCTGLRGALPVPRQLRDPVLPFVRLRAISARGNALVRDEPRAHDRHRAHPADERSRAAGHAPARAGERPTKVGGARRASGGESWVAGHDGRDCFA